MTILLYKFFVKWNFPHPCRHAINNAACPLQVARSRLPIAFMLFQMCMSVCQVKVGSLPFQGRRDIKGGWSIQCCWNNVVFNKKQIISLTQSNLLVVFLATLVKACTQRSNYQNMRNDVIIVNILAVNTDLIPAHWRTG